MYISLLIRLYITYSQLFLFFILAAPVFSIAAPIKEEQDVLKKIQSAFEQKNMEDAKELWDEHHPKYPYSISFDYWGGKILLYVPEAKISQRKSNFHKAILRLKKVTTSLQANIIGNREAKRLYLDSMYHLALAFFFLNDVDRAISTIKKVIEVDASLLNAWLNLTIFYEVRGYQAQAYKAYKKYLYLLESVEDDF